MSPSDKDLLTGSDQCEPRWKDDFEKSVGLFFFPMLCFSGYLSIPSCPYQSLFSLVNTNFLLVYQGKQSSLFTSRLGPVYSGMTTSYDSCLHIQLYGHSTPRPYVCLSSGVLIMDGGARRCLRADLTLDPVTADGHRNNFGDSHTSTLVHCLVHTPSQTQTVWPFFTPLTQTLLCPESKSQSMTNLCIYFIFEQLMRQICKTDYSTRLWYWKNAAHKTTRIE